MTASKLGPLVTLQLCAIEIELQQKNYDGRSLGSKLWRQIATKETWLARKGEILVQATEPTKLALLSKRLSMRWTHCRRDAATFQP